MEGKNWVGEIMPEIVGTNNITNWCPNGGLTGKPPLLSKFKLFLLNEAGWYYQGGCDWNDLKSCFILCCLIDFCPPLSLQMIQTQNISPPINTWILTYLMQLTPGDQFWGKYQVEYIRTKHHYLIFLCSHSESTGIFKY